MKIQNPTTKDKRFSELKVGEFFKSSHTYYLKITPLTAYNLITDDCLTPRNDLDVTPVEMEQCAVEFESLSCGTVFHFDNDLFLKISEQEAFCLTRKACERFDSDAHVVVHPESWCVKS